ncbi:CHAT domain-containing protein [Favolaschia claudopus]|uniref:CHAT domain-containing protein n=1 Tax=Favolaschia claudopus TaxID=2862362 RepID=A0AAV9Z7R7_9AGAR
MSELHTVITLHELHIESLIYPHEDLPDGMKMSAQLIIDQYIWLHTQLVKSEPSGKSWKLRVGCNIPAQAAMFQVVFLGHTFECLLNTVNSDGPTLRLGAGFAISQSSCHHPSISDFIALPDSKIASVASETVTNDLQQAWENSNMEQLTTNSLNIWLMHERILLGCQEGKERAQLLNILGDIGMKKYNSVGSIQDLSQTICTCADAVRDNSIDPDNLMSPTFLADLGVALLVRVKQLRRLEDITRAIKMLQQSVHLTPDGHPDKPSRLNNLGSSLLWRFKRLGNRHDLDQCIAHMEAAVNLAADNDPDRLAWMSNLGLSLGSRFYNFWNLDDLNQAITFFEACVNSASDSNPKKPDFLGHLGNALLRRYDHTEDLNDAVKSMTYTQAAVDLTPDGHPNRSSWLGDLGLSFLNRFIHLGDLDDLNQSITYLEIVVNLIADDDIDRSKQLNHLGCALLKRYEQLGNLDDVNQSITCRAAALELIPDGHIDRPSFLGMLGDSFYHRFQHLGDLGDLNQAVTYIEARLDLTPDGHPDKSGQLNCLNILLAARFRQFGDLDDLNKAIAQGKAGVNFTADCHPDKLMFLSSLGESFLWRFDRLGNLADLNQCITQFEACVELTPDGHTRKPKVLHNLAVALGTRFLRLRNPADVNRAIICAAAAVEHHPGNSLYLATLGGAFCHRFVLLWDFDDLDQCITYIEAAVHLLPDDHLEKPSRLFNLGEDEDCQKLLYSFSSAACSSSGAAWFRFSAAEKWATFARACQPSAILKAYTTAIAILPELAWLALSIADRHHRLLTVGKLVRDGAAAAIAAGDYQKSVEWLEQGRSIIWGQFLELRTPVDKLKQSHPELAEQFISYSKTLEVAGTKTTSIDEYITPKSTNVRTKNFHEIVHKRENVLAQIRQQPGFEQFLLPKSISHLSHAADSGPVVILNISGYQCDGLILLPDLQEEVIHVPLPSFTSSCAEELVELLASTLGTDRHIETLAGEVMYHLPRKHTFSHADEFDELLESIRGTTVCAERLQGSREGKLTPDQSFSRILSELWIKIVQPILKAIAITRPTDDPERIWWCPTGPLAFLPIHAAGLYGKDQDGKDHPFGSNHQPMGKPTFQELAKKLFVL